MLDPEKVDKLVAASKITEDGSRTYLALAGGDVRRAVHDGARTYLALAGGDVRRAVHIARYVRAPSSVIFEASMSVLKTELEKDERARDVEAMERATFYLSSIDDSALIDQVHRECAPDGGGTKSRVENQATGSGPGSRSRAHTRQ
jgi:hypothetical protein